jgi:hypothetical protein
VTCTPGRRWGEALAVFFCLSMLAAGCGSAGPSSPDRVAAPSSLSTGSASNPLNQESGSGEQPVAALPQQTIYNAKLLRDDRALDRGVLAYSPLRRLKTNTQVQFTVSVTDVGNGPQLVSISSVNQNGLVFYRKDVPTGAIVGVQMVACTNLKCRSESATRQPILQKNDQAEWLWQITAGAPGSAAIILRADTYDTGTNVVLREEIIQVKTTVIATSAYDQVQSHKRLSAVGKGVTNGLGMIFSIAGGIVAIGTIVGWGLVRMRKRSQKRKAAFFKSKTGDVTNGHPADRAGQPRG